MTWRSWIEILGFAVYSGSLVAQGELHGGARIAVVLVGGVGLALAAWARWRSSLPTSGR